jgi:hypothetical protein
MTFLQTCIILHILSIFLPGTYNVPRGVFDIYFIDSRTHNKKHGKYLQKVRLSVPVLGNVGHKNKATYSRLVPSYGIYIITRRVWCFTNELYVSYIAYLVWIFVCKLNASSQHTRNNLSPYRESNPVPLMPTRQRGPLDYTALSISANFLHIYYTHIVW